MLKLQLNPRHTERVGEQVVFDTAVRDGLEHERLEPRLGLQSIIPVQIRFLPLFRSIFRANVRPGQADECLNIRED